MPTEEQRKRNREKQKRYYEKHKKEIYERNKNRVAKWNAENKEKVNAYKTKYRLNNPEKSKKSDTLSGWKQRGLIHDDYDDLYEKYLASTHCEICDVLFNNDEWRTTKCMDHCHKTGVFRNFLCQPCNLKRE